MIHYQTLKGTYNKKVHAKHCSPTDHDSDVNPTFEPINLAWILL